MATTALDENDNKKIIAYIFEARRDYCNFFPKNNLPRVLQQLEKENFHERRLQQVPFWSWCLWYHKLREKTDIEYQSSFLSFFGFTNCSYFVMLLPPGPLGADTLGDVVRGSKKLRLRELFTCRTSLLRVLTLVSFHLLKRIRYLGLSGVVFRLRVAPNGLYRPVNVWLPAAATSLSITFFGSFRVSKLIKLLLRASFEAGCIFSRIDLEFWEDWLCLRLILMVSLIFSLIVSLSLYLDL